MAKRRRRDIREAFGDAVRTLRTEAGLSQEALADAAGLHRTYVGSVERGERNIALVNIERLADALGISIADLMARVERRQRRPMVRPSPEERR